MVNWKSKYLAMKLKYINSKNKIKGGISIELIIFFTGNFFTFENNNETAVFDFDTFFDNVRADFNSLQLLSDLSNNIINDLLEDGETKFVRIFKLLMLNPNLVDYELFRPQILDLYGADAMYPDEAKKLLMK